MSLLAVIYWVLVVLLAIGWFTRDRYPVAFPGAVIVLFVIIGLHLFAVSLH